MTNLSVRLPPEIERSLDREAQLSGKSRSDLVREAVGEYVTRKERERFIRELAEEMRRGYGDADTRQEALDLAADTSVDGLEALIKQEHLSRRRHRSGREVVEAYDRNSRDGESAYRSAIDSLSHLRL